MVNIVSIDAKLVYKVIIITRLFFGNILRSHSFPCKSLLLLEFKKINFEFKKGVGIAIKSKETSR